METRVFWLFCLLAALRSVEVTGDASKNPKIVFKDNELLCENGVFDYKPMFLTEDAHVIYTCMKNDTDQCPDEDTCSKQRILVKVLTSVNMIQLDTPALISVLVADVVVTVMIGWAVYSICAQPRVRSSYTGNKASDRQNLIPNNSGGETYQPLNTRSSEYSTLHGPRKPKNSKHPL